jgi:hypothetical protein
MAKSCMEVAQTLVECMKSTPCVKAGGDIRKCMKETDECQVFWLYHEYVHSIPPLLNTYLTIACL